MQENNEGRQQDANKGKAPRRDGQRNSNYQKGDRKFSSFSKGGKPSFGRSDGAKPSFGRKDGERAGAGRGDRKFGDRKFGERKEGFQRDDFRKADGKPEGRRFARPQGERKDFGKDRGEKRFEDRKPFEKKPFDRPRGEKHPHEIRPFDGERKAPREENKGVSLARLSAFRVLQDVTVRNAFTSLALDKVLTANSLSDVDKRLAASIVYNTLENLIQIDYIIDGLMEKPTTEPVLRDVLRMSIAQMLYMNKIPDFAVINEAVKLIRVVSIVEAWAGVVNGVLRNFLRNKEHLQLPKEEDDKELYLSIKHSMPLWLIQKLVKSFGYEEAKAIVSYQKSDNRTSIRRNFMHISESAFEDLLAKKGWDYEKGLVPHAYLIKNIDSIAEDLDYKKGLFSVQGQSSMLAAMAVENGLGQTVLDACAAPGGKTFYMAEKQQGSGRVYAWDIHQHRVDLIREQMYRLNTGNVRVAHCDATQYREDLFEFFDRILIDAPCSNLGVMFEKPDVKYKAIEEDMDSLLATQYKILENCAKYLKPGGVLVYSTCSILPEENYEQVAKFLKNHENFTMLAMPESFPEEIKVQANAEGLSLFAHKSGLEGFYIARMRKNG